MVSDLTRQNVEQTWWVGIGMRQSTEKEEEIKYKPFADWLIETRVVWVS